jgi:hypothetical protein
VIRRGLLVVLVVIALLIVANSMGVNLVVPR